MGDLVSSLGGNFVDLANTATVFGQGAIASDISGNPIYSQDPAAAAYATGSARVATNIARSPVLIIVILFVLYKLLK